MQGPLGSIQYTIINAALGVGFADNKVSTDIVEVERVSDIKDIIYIAGMNPSDYVAYTYVSDTDTLTEATLLDEVKIGRRIILVHEGLSLNKAAVLREVRNTTDIWANAYPARPL